MGLDMYLYKETYVGANYEHRNVHGTVEITAHGEPLPIQFDRISTITEVVAYWRKANAIHKWFVENCQDGVDECQHSYVSRENLETLLGLCKQVQADHSKAADLLPTQSGFFFGGTGYDEWYLEDIDNTVTMLEKILAEPDTGQFIYHSSW